MEGGVSTMRLGGGRLVCSTIWNGPDVEPPTLHLCYHVCSNVCNGLVCVRNMTKGQVLLLNLTTRETKVLLHLETGIFRLPEFYLGFDPVSRKYKVVSFYYTRNLQWYYEIVTLGSKIIVTRSSLSKQKFLLISTLLSTQFSSVNAQGKFYWMNKDKQQVVYFDLVSEKSGAIALPEAMRTESCVPRIISVDGKVAIATKGKKDFGWLVLWVYDGDTTAWRKERWELPQGVVVGGDFAVLGCLDGGGILLKTGSLLFCFGRNTGECQSIPINPRHSHYSYATVLHQIVDANIAPFALLLQ